MSPQKQSHLHAPLISSQEVIKFAMAAIRLRVITSEFDFGFAKLPSERYVVIVLDSVSLDLCSVLCAVAGLRSQSQLRKASNISQLFLPHLRMSYATRRQSSKLREIVTQTAF